MLSMPIGVKVTHYKITNIVGRKARIVVIQKFIAVYTLMLLLFFNGGVMFSARDKIENFTRIIYIRAIPRWYIFVL